MTEQIVLADKERELVAVGAAVGAGCQPCTQYHVKAALKSGLSQEAVERAIDGAQGVRGDGGIAVSNVGRRVLGIGEEPARRNAAQLEARRSEAGASRGRSS